MPIPITPTDIEVQVTTKQMVKADKLHIDKFLVQDPSRSRPGLELIVTPYAGEDADRKFGESSGMRTNDLYKALENFAAAGLKKPAAAMTAIFEAVGEFAQYRAVRKAEMDAAAKETQAAQARLEVTPDDEDLKAKLDEVQKRETVARLAWLDPANPILK